MKNKKNKFNIHDFTEFEHFVVNLCYYHMTKRIIAESKIEKAIKRIEYTNFEQVENPAKLFIYLDELSQILKGEEN